jgi:hypothetical protein
LKNSFAVQYAVHLWLASASITGPFGAFVALIAAHFLGDLLDKGIINLDITIDKLKDALKDAQWREAALKAHDHATAKALTEEEKIAIRKEYKDALAKYATYGNGVPDSHKNP